MSSYEVLQQDLADVLADNGLALVVGDFNARTGSASGTCLEDFSDLWGTSLQPDGQLCENLKSRTSDDQHTCAFGKTLLDLCEMSDLCILKGCAPKDDLQYSTRLECRGLLFDECTSSKNSTCNGCT